MSVNVRGRAFTLIELLIVVAIIAILAAIAVPNFMEAQVRSKVARCKADQRSIATAIESYTVDWNQPPPSFRFWVTSYEGDLKGYSESNVTWTQARWNAIMAITTPVAYMSAYPTDPFATQGTKWQIEADSNYGNTFNPVMTYYRYEDYTCHWWADASTTNLGNTASALVRNMGYRWAVYSPGPTKYDYVNCVNALRGKITHSAAGRQLPTYFPYDPTNGTMSEGLVVRTNMGVWETLLYDTAQEL